MAAVTELASEVGASAACQALCLPRASYYRDRRKPFSPEGTGARPSPARALRPAECASVLACLHQERFQDRSPAAVYATLLDEGKYLCSIRSMYRLLEKRGECRERRDQSTHPPYKKPELLATTPNQLWSWDITKLLGPVKWTYFYLYVILDVFSRYVTGWMMAIRVCSVIPTRRHTSTTGTPASACFTTATICSTEKRFLTAKSPFPSRVRFCRKTNTRDATEFGGRSAELRPMMLAAARYSSALILPVAIVYLLRGRTFGGLWMGSEYAKASSQVLAILTFSWMFNSVNRMAGAVMLGISKHRPMVPVAVAVAEAPLQPRHEHFPGAQDGHCECSLGDYDSKSRSVPALLALVCAARFGDPDTQLSLFDVGSSRSGKPTVCDLHIYCGALLAAYAPMVFLRASATGPAGRCCWSGNCPRFS